MFLPMSFMTRCRASGSAASLAPGEPGDGGPQRRAQCQRADGAHFERCAAQDEQAEVDKHESRGGGDAERQPPSPWSTTCQTDRRRDVGEAGEEVEADDEGHVVARRLARRLAPE
jgi:hypothetical protein